jgi:hypothetical protein
VTGEELRAADVAVREFFDQAPDGAVALRPLQEWDGTQPR